LQPVGAVVSIADWEPDEDFPFGPQGAKPKRIVICPSPAPQPYLIGGHRYLFKEPGGSKAQQIWTEVIAYELARTIGVSVPPAFLAYDPRDHSPGVLVEFFHGDVWNPAVRFVHAIERFQGLGIPVNEKHGSLRDNVKLTRVHQIVDWRDWWGATIAFDAMIGNTDRHSENWGFLVDQSGENATPYSMAPAFDNGTSLGFLVRDADLDKFMTRRRLADFVARGRHHFGWLPDSDEDSGHAALCGRFVKVYGGAGGRMRKTIQLTDSRIAEVVEWCARFDFPVAFSETRGEFVLAQVKARRDAVAAAIGV
jgi:hypothetical protein